MAQQTINVNASASLTARGQTTATGSISWTVPSFPDGVDHWDNVHIEGNWTWGGKGSISRVTINGTKTSNGIEFNIALPTNQSSPLSITCVGNKNATGSSFTWRGLKVVYTYTPPITEKTTLYITLNGEVREVEAIYKTVNNQVVEVQPEDLNRNANYVLGAS